MNAAAIALVLFGCSDDMSQCVKVGSQPFSTMAQCRSATAHALETRTALSADYPTMTAMCMSAQKVALIGNRTQDFSRDWQ